MTNNVENETILGGISAPAADVAGVSVPTGEALKAQDLGIDFSMLTEAQKAGVNALALKVAFFKKQQLDSLSPESVAAMTYSQYALALEEFEVCMRYEKVLRYLLRGEL